MQAFDQLKLRYRQ